MSSSSVTFPHSFRNYSSLYFPKHLTLFVKGILWNNSHFSLTQTPVNSSVFKYQYLTLYDFLISKPLYFFEYYANIFFCVDICIGLLYYMSFNVFPFLSLPTRSFVSLVYSVPEDVIKQLLIFHINTKLFHALVSLF